MLKFNVEVITPSVAAAYLEHNTDNRRRNKGKIAFYADMMSNGEWEVNGESIKFAPNGRLLDGQHRLMACVQANVPFETVVIRDIEEKVFDTLDQGWTRGKAQIFDISNIPNSKNISAAINRFLVLGKSKVTSLDSSIAGGKRKQNSPRECLKEYSSRPEYWQNIHKTTSAMYSRCRLMNLSEIGALIAHLNLNCKYELGYVIEFFDQLFYEEYTQMDIIRMLRQRLTKDAMSAIKMISQVKTQLIRKTWDCYKVGNNPSVLKWTKGVEDEKPFS